MFISAHSLGIFVKSDVFLQVTHEHQKTLMRHGFAVLTVDGFQMMLTLCACSEELKRPSGIASTNARREFFNHVAPGRQFGMSLPVTGSRAQRLYSLKPPFQ